MEGKRIGNNNVSWSFQMHDAVQSVTTRTSTSIMRLKQCEFKCQAGKKKQEVVFGSVV